MTESREAVTSRRDVVIFAQAVRGEPPVLCNHCVDELEAYGVEVVSLTISGSRPYLWRHVGTRLETCTRTYQARPYDDFAAHRQIKTKGDEEWPDD